MTTCPNCGFENAPGAKFCSECGTALVAAPAERREERKVVTVVFCDVVGSTARAEAADPEDVRAALQTFYARVRSELERFGGTVEKFIGDAVMAVFGAPVAHEDDPERAVRAALAIRDWAREDGGLEVRLAVNTGEALVALGARADSGEAMVAGDVVNTAARMQSAAPVNGVLVGETTQRATRAAIEYAPAEPMIAKGKAEPVPVWEALGARSRVTVEEVGRNAPLVGRGRELDALADALDRARTQREPQLVTLVGVPGIGKSRLVAELFRLVDEDPALIIWRHGRSLPYGESTPLYAFAAMVKAHAGILDTDPAEVAAAKLRDATRELAPGDEELERRLRPLTGLETSLAGAAGDARAQSFAAWRRWVEALAEQGPVVLVFEDLHWADDDLLDFVDHLVDWVSGVPLLVVASARPELLERRPGWGGGKRNALTISLAPLDEVETARLLAELLGRAVLSAETQTELLARAGGNPLYAEQFAAMVAERGEAGGVPETVQGIIAARLDGLAAAEKNLLQTAAVLGRQFWLGAVVAADGADRTSAEELLHSLQRKEFVRRERRSSVAGETEFSFAHVLVRDVAYGQIPRAARGGKHRAAAAWLETLSADRAEDRADLLAHHYLAALELAQATGGDMADLADAARRALRDAAERAHALGAFDAAARLYGQALELWAETDPEYPAAVVRHAEALFYAAERVDTGAVAAAAEQLAARHELALAAKAEIIAAVGAWWDGRGDAAQAHASRAVELVREAPPSAEKAMVLVERARLFMVASRAREALEVGGEGLEMAQRLGLDNITASALVTLGTAQGLLLGGVGEGTKLLERAIELADSLNSPQQLQRAHVNLGELRWQHAHLSEVTELFRAARRYGHALGDPYQMRWLDTSECELAYLRGYWEDAEARADAFVADVDAGSPYTTENIARGVRAEIRRARGDVDSARAEAERGLAAAREVGDPQSVGPSLALLARFRLDDGHDGEAAALVDELLALAGDDGGFAHFNWIVGSAWLARDLGRLEAWEARARREVPSPCLEIGEAVTRGAFEQAAELLTAKGHATEAAYAWLRAAEAAAAARRQADAERCARSALDFYRSVGATAFLRRGEALLAATA